MKVRFLAAFILAVTALPLGVSAQPYNGYGADHHDGPRFIRTSGVIRSANGGNFKLRGGPVVFLKGNTVIRPRGTTLQRGMRVSVSGTPAGNGNINATRVEVTGGR
jgi:hypothetical protein